MTLERLLRDLMPELLRYFVRRLDDREDAADALSETLIVLWRKQRTLPSDEEGCRRYAFGIARNVLGAARRGRLKHRVIADALALELAAPVVYESDPDLEAALKQLPEKDRELILLVAWEGFGVAEAGAVLGLKPDASRARYSRARARLRQMLEPQHPRAVFRTGSAVR